MIKYTSFVRIFERNEILMAVWEIILGALLIVASLIMIIVIILQEGNQQGVGVVSGGADTFFSQNKARTYDKFLASATKWVAIGFVVIVLALNVIAYFAGSSSVSAADADATESVSVSESVDSAASDESAADETAQSDASLEADDTVQTEAVSET